MIVAMLRGAQQWRKAHLSSVETGAAVYVRSYNILAKIDRRNQLHQKDLSTCQNGSHYLARSQGFEHSCMRFRFSNARILLYPSPLLSLLATVCYGVCISLFYTRSSNLTPISDPIQQSSQPFRSVAIMPSLSYLASWYVRYGRTLVSWPIQSRNEAFSSLQC